MSRNSKKLEIAANICLTIAILGFAILLGLGLPDMARKANEKVLKKTYIKSIVLDTETKGTFILGCGSVSGTNYYVAYGLTEDGAEYFLKIPTNDTYIYYTLPLGEPAYMIEQKDELFEITEKRYLYLPENARTEVYDLSLQQVKEK